MDWAAESTAATTDPIQLLLQYGVLGIFAALLLMYARGSIAREREKTDQAMLQVKELNEFIRSELLPKQVEATLLHKQVAEVLEDAVKLMSEARIRETIQREGGRHA